MQSLSRALTVLDILGRRAGPLTLGDIAGEVGLHKSTVHRMLATFVEHGLVRRDEANRYVIGLGVIDLARAARGEAVSVERVRRPLEALSGLTGQPSEYLVPRGAALVRVGAVDATGRSRIDAGGPISMHCTVAGIVYLAYRPRHEVDRYVERMVTAPHRVDAGSTTSSFMLRRVLTRVRELGYALDPVGEAVEATAVAVPVLGADGLAFAAVASGLPPGLVGLDFRRFVHAASGCAERIAASVGVHGTRRVGPAGHQPDHNHGRGA